MRKAMAILSVVALGVAGSARAEDKKDESKVARAMAVAEIDFELHRAQLGLVGSSLLSERQVKRESPANPVLVAKTEPDATAVPGEAPAAPAAISDPK